jgi:hypothetical protein
MNSMKLSAWLQDHFVVASLIVLFLSTVPRVFIAWRADPSELLISLPDASSYIGPAQNLITQQSFLDSNGKPEIYRTPGYPAFLVTIMLLVGQDLHRILLLQAFILSFEVLVLYWFASRILPQLTAFTGAVLAAFSPWGAVRAALPLTEGLFLLVLALIFFTMKITVEFDKQSYSVIGGAVTGLLVAAAVLVRPVWPLVLLVGGVFLFLYGPRRKGVWVILSILSFFAVTPLFLWKARNERVGQFSGLSDVAGVCPSQMLGSRVEAYLTHQDKWNLFRRAFSEQAAWKMSIQEADQERWRRAIAIFREHPILTAYFFLLDAGEHTIHPDQTVLSPAKLNFSGEYWVLALFWGGMLMLAYFGWRYNAGSKGESGTTDRDWLLGLLVVCSLLTVSSGVCFGAGSRLRVPLELIVPLLAAAGLLRLFFAQKNVLI